MNYRFFVLMIFVLSFLFSCGEETILKPEDNNMDTVQIGSQVWMHYNLNVSHYRNGELVRQAISDNDWIDAANKKEGAWSYFGNDKTNGEIYGKLYNWYAVNDSRGLAPDGWHIPTDTEWNILFIYLGGKSVAGGKMKETGTNHWYIPNTGATNSSGFSGLPGGYISIGNYYGSNGSDFEYMNVCGIWWSSTEYNDSTAFNIGLGFDVSSILRNNNKKTFGFSVRCIKDK